VFNVPILGQISQYKLDSIVQKYTQNLHTKGIDTFCIYSEYCIGCLLHHPKGNNLCLENYSSLPTYIFWKDNGKTFITRKDICFDYSTQIITNDSFWNYFISNKSKIKKEELKLPQYIENINGKKEIQSININHSIYFQITMKINSESVVKKINSFYLTEELGIKGEKNINYDYNTHSNLHNLHLLLQGIIKQESIKKKFIKTLR